MPDKPTPGPTPRDFATLIGAVIIYAMGVQNGITPREAFAAGKTFVAEAEKQIPGVFDEPA